MHKFRISAILVFIILFSCSCSIGGSRTRMLNKDNNKKAEAGIEEVIEALDNKDKEALEAMFSKQALDDADDFTGNMDHMLDLFQGGIDSSYESEGSSEHELNDYGHIKKEVRSYYYVNTGKQKYFFLLQDYPADTDHPDNVGLYMLLVVKAEDEEKIYDGDQKILFDGDKKLSHAGIYLPLE